MSNFPRKWMVLLVLGARLFIGGPTQAGEKKSERTWSEMVDLVLKNGKDKIIDSGSAENLGLVGDVMAKQLRRKASASEDGQDHGFAVAFSTDSKGKVRPTGIILRVSKLVKKGEARFIEGWGMRISLDGKLMNAYWVEGEVGVEVNQATKPVASAEVKSVFEKEREMFLKTVPFGALIQ